MGVPLARLEQLGPLEMVEPDRAGAVADAALCRSLQAPAKQGDVNPRHFLGWFRIADLGGRSRPENDKSTHPKRYGLESP